MFMTVKQASEKWGISDRRIRVLCSEQAGRFSGRAKVILYQNDKPLGNG